MSLREGFDRSSLTFFQALLEYRTMGGKGSSEQVAAALRGQDVLNGYEYDKLVAALNDYFVEAGEDHRVGHDGPGGS